MSKNDVTSIEVIILGAKPLYCKVSCKVSILMSQVMYLLQKSKWIDTWTREVGEALEAVYWCFMVLKKIEYENRYLRRYFQNFSWGIGRNFIY